MYGDQWKVRNERRPSGPTLKTPAEIAAWYEKTYAARLDTLSKLTGEQLMKMVDFRGMFQRPAVMFLMIGAHHTIFIIAVSN